MQHFSNRKTSHSLFLCLFFTVPGDATRPPGALSTLQGKNWIERQVQELRAFSEGAEPQEKSYTSRQIWGIVFKVFQLARQCALRILSLFQPFPVEFEHRNPDSRNQEQKQE